jgi:hypothetical protein
MMMIIVAMNETLIHVVYLSRVHGVNPTKLPSHWRRLVKYEDYLPSILIMIYWSTCN